MGFQTLAIAYVLGGLTFLPLVFATVLASAWYLLPRIRDTDESSSGQKSDAPAAHEGDGVEEQRNRSRQESFSDAGASGTFAVLRQYDFPSAVGALNARNNTGGGANVNADGSLMADAGSNESIYQSMYRSVFAGRKDAGASSLLDNGDIQNDPTVRRKAVPANVMYIVLRHSHLMLYESPAQVEVKHVISLAHHKVTLQAEKDGEQEADEKSIKEADLFTKRTAIVLTPFELPNGALQANVPKVSRPFYLFCGTNIDKEDFYHALLATRAKPPIPRVLDSDSLIKLQSALHSSSLTPEARALSALLGRVFLGIHRTDVLVDFVRSKVENKLRKIQKPSFIPLLEIRSLDLGDAGPVVSNLKLKDLNISGDTTVSVDMKYSGGLSLTLLAVAKLDLGPRFKARTVDLILKTTLHRVSGTMLLRVKPAPSNRIWFCFESMPDLDVRVEPVVSERKITYSFVLRAIEERVRAAFAEGLVKPNWDDVPMPLQDTQGSHARGGIWSDAGMEDHAAAHSSAPQRGHERKISNATLSDVKSATSTGLSSNSDSNLARLRHASTMPTHEGASKRRPVSSLKNWNEGATNPEKSPRPPKPLRSPSIIAMSPSVAIDDHTVERADDASIRGSTTPQGRSLWRTRGSPSFQQSQKDALEELRDLRDRAEQAIARPSAVAISDSDTGRRSSDPDLVEGKDHRDSDSIESRQYSDGSGSTVAGTPRSFSLRSTDTDRSSDTSFSSSTLPRSQNLQQKKTTILAAAGAATNAARNWGWNTIQKNKGAFQRPGGRLEQPARVPNEPMGRGQPLPPPGMPLPGPQKGVWAGMGSIRRKPAPALPSRGPRAEDPSAEHPSSGEDIKHDPSQTAVRHGLGALSEDEFGTWHENSGAAADQDLKLGSAMTGPPRDGPSAPLPSKDHPHTPADREENLLGPDDILSASASKINQDLEGQKSKRAPPPLPARRTKSTIEQPAFEDTTEPSVAPLVEIDPGGTTALRVPDSAADTVAAENSTAELALGATDDIKHFDEAERVETQDGSEKRHSQQILQDAKEGSDAQSTDDMEQKFVRGEDVTENDFEWLTHEIPREQREQVSIAQETGAVEQTESDGVVKRIKAQVQKHEAENQGAWHGKPQGMAVDVSNA